MNNIQANSKTIIIFVAGALIAAFFMGWLQEWGIPISAWDMIFGQVGANTLIPLQHILPS